VITRTKMSQQNVLKLLKRKKKWMTSKEISKILGLGSVNASLKKLYEQGLVSKREIKSGYHFVYEYKIK